MIVGASKQVEFVGKMRRVAADETLHGGHVELAYISCVDHLDDRHAQVDTECEKVDEHK